MATGLPPWGLFANPIAALFNIANNKEPPPLPECLSEEAKDFLKLCLQIDPEKRKNAKSLLKHSFLYNCPAKKSKTQSMIKLEINRNEQK